ncbi:hypothetical protein [Leptospira paudalimensis]|uniref:Uncharacterized protein n=1 Tax=Leptospira paudalimensis TaxID=2950024 RepID=A0ABT3M651_9LEPT|nr:hypothetical protein [Leptospira paudalimensis]MCW7503874.1 hypothetical protein [Leptospira paudalimensis]
MDIAEFYGNIEKSSQGMAIVKLIFSKAYKDELHIILFNPGLILECIEANKSLFGKFDRVDIGFLESIDSINYNKEYTSFFIRDNGNSFTPV